MLVRPPQDSVPLVSMCVLVIALGGAGALMQSVFDRRGPLLQCRWLVRWKLTRSAGGKIVGLGCVLALVWVLSYTVT